MNDPVAIVLVVVVTGVLTGILVLLFRAGNRLQERLSPQSREETLAEQRPVEAQPGAELRAEARLDRLSEEEAAGPFRRLAEALTAADLDGVSRMIDEELRGHDPLRQKRVLELLPGLGEAYARPLAAVVLRLAGEGADLGVRTRALRALGGLKVPFDGEVAGAGEGTPGTGAGAQKRRHVGVVRARAARGSGAREGAGWGVLDGERRKGLEK